MYQDSQNTKEVTLDINIFNKLRVRYIVALIGIAVAIILSQLLIEDFLKKQLGDSRVINVAGRQRMLSQNITKEVLLIYISSDPEDRLEHAGILEESLDLWSVSHHSLINRDPSMSMPGKNSDTIKVMFNTLSVYFDNIVSSSGKLINLIKGNPGIQSTQIKIFIDRVLSNESMFLPLMDKVVNQYDKEALQKVKDVIRIETVLLILSLGILIFEFFFIFQPTAYYIKKTIRDLIQSEEMEKQDYKNIIKVKSEEQKYRSSLIFEGQERERRRLSRDLHDGIGQMLTGLKFQFEAISNNMENVSAEKLNMLKELTSDVIKEVRRVSFNLRPTVLSDYGLSSGIKNIVNELNLYSDIELIFNNETNFNGRLDKKIETHLYRITQEAINNALKYSKSDKIIIRLWHEKDMVNISVKDFGIGFNMDETENRDLKKEKGHGIFNMKERASFINAILKINTAKGKGTEIIIFSPLN